VDRFVEFVRKHANPVQHYYCAYPKASAKMVAQALALEARHDQLAQQAGTVDDAAFDAKWRAFVTDNQELLAGGGEPQERPGTVPSTLVVLARVRGEDARQLEQELADLEGKESPFAHMSGTHFARLAFVPALCGPDDELLDSEGPFLLLAADFDGELREWAAELCGKAGAALDPILRCWEGFPGVGDPVKVAKFLISRNAPPGLTFAGYHATVPEVLKAVRLCGKLRALAVRAQNERLGPAALRQAWQSDVRDAA
jgi:hypothetical protein